MQAYRISTYYNNYIVLCHFSKYSKTRFAGGDDSSHMCATDWARFWLEFLIKCDSSKVMHPYPIEGITVWPFEQTICSVIECLGECLR